MNRRTELQENIEECQISDNNSWIIFVTKYFSCSCSATPSSSNPYVMVDMKRNQNLFEAASSSCQGHLVRANK